MSVQIISERDPLLPRVVLPDDSSPIDARVITPAEKNLGPLELAPSTRYTILLGISIANFLSSLNMTLVATLLPSISSEFNKSHLAAWLGTSYLLATCTFTPLYGRLCNVLGRRGANQTAVLFAGLGSLASGFAPNMETLIAARFLGGIGGGGIFTTAQIITSDMFSLRSRGLAQGYSSIFSGIGMGLGGPIGGLVTDRFGWRWAFLMQMPLFLLSFCLTGYNLRYVTPGNSKSPKEVLKRIDYGGSAALFAAVLSILLFLSNKYNEALPWDDRGVVLSIVFACVSTVAFIIIELWIAPEPVLAPFLLKQKIPVLIAISNFLVSMCNFSVMYFFPTWFQTVMLTSASTAGLHLLPNSVSMSTGSIFAGWVMHRTGKYKMINAVFGFLPFIAGVLMVTMNENSSPARLWLSIIPLGFGNAVVLQTMLIALLAHIPQSVMAVGTGFGQLFRGIGQVGGVGISSAIFQTILDRELQRRIHTPDAEDTIRKIRQSATLIASLPPDLQKVAKDSYAVALRAVFIFATCSTLCAYLVRIPIPDKTLDESPSTSESEGTEHFESPIETPCDSDNENDQRLSKPPMIRTVVSSQNLRRPRRLSTYESHDGVLDLESDTIGGSARTF